MNSTTRPGEDYEQKSVNRNKRVHVCNNYSYGLCFSLSSNYYDLSHLNWKVKIKTNQINKTLLLTLLNHYICGLFFKQNMQK